MPRQNCPTRKYAGCQFTKVRCFQAPKVWHIKRHLVFFCAAILSSLLPVWIHAEPIPPKDAVNAIQNDSANQAELQDQRQVTETLLLDIATQGNLMLAVGQRGHIIRSSDAGKNFYRIHSGTKQTLTSICFISNKIIIAAGHNLTLLRSSDAGKTWQHIPLEIMDTAPWLDLIALNEREILAIGAYGHMARSIDQGKTWQVTFPTEEDYHLNAIIRTDEQQLFIAGEAGRTYLSNDLGRTWRTLTPPYSGSLFAAHPISKQKILLVGLRGNAILGDLSKDEPLWLRIELGTNRTFFDVSQQKNSEHLWLAGAAGQLVQLDTTQLAVLITTEPQSSNTHDLTSILKSADRKDRADIANVLIEKGELWTVGQNGLKRYQIAPNIHKNDVTDKTLLMTQDYAFHP